MDAPCRIELLGGLRIVQDERVFTRFRSQKFGALLAYLAYYLPQNHPREILIEMLWPEVEPAVGRHRLSMALSSLRHQLEPPGVPAGAVLQADRFHVHLNPQAVTTDVTEFEAALKCNALQQAIELYRGPLLPGYYEAWIVPEMMRLEELHIQAYQRLETRNKEILSVLPAPASTSAFADSAPDRPLRLPLQFTRFLGHGLC